MLTRLTDADALIKETCVEGAYGYVDAKQIADTPTIDDVKIVRCKDCKHYNGLTCNNREWRNMSGVNTGWE